MPISSLHLRKPLRSSALLAAALVLTGIHAPAQTLARPGWEGSGMASESWWRNAVFYRINVAGFQDSNGDGTGDLQGIANRMDYLQGLGVDAIVLDNLGNPNQDDTGFAEVLRDALPRHIRVLVTLNDTSLDSDDNVAGQARLWLTRGAAGIYLRTTRSADEVAPLLHLLRKLTDSFPGSRVLLSEIVNDPDATPLPPVAALAHTTSTAAITSAPVPAPAPVGRVHPINFDDPTPPKPAAAPARAPRQAPVRADSPRSVSFLNNAQLNGVPLELTNATAATIRIALHGMNSAPAASSFFLSEEMFSTKEILDPANKAALDGRRRAFALVLLASRGAAAMRYGQEVGLLPIEATNNPPIMPWTPTNVTAPPRPMEEVKPQPAPTPIPTRSDVYGTFKPYVAGPRPIVLPRPAGEDAGPATTASAAVTEPSAPPVDPNSLPGFTTGKLPQPLPAEAATLNAATEDTDPHSLLNLYRRLIELHHDNPTLRNGQEILLNYDSLGAVVWIRQPNSGLRSTAIIAVCNLSGAPLHLSLDQELTQQHVHTGTLRNLLSATPSATSVQSTDNLTLPAYGVFLGELYH